MKENISCAAGMASRRGFTFTIDSILWILLENKQFTTIVVYINTILNESSCSLQFNPSFSGSCFSVVIITSGIPTTWTSILSGETDRHPTVISPNSPWASGLNCVWFGIVRRCACTTHLFIGKRFLNGILQYQTGCLLLNTHSTWKYMEDLNACHEGLQVIISWMLLKITSTLARLTNSRHPTIHCTVLVPSPDALLTKTLSPLLRFKRPTFGSSPRVIISRYI